MPGEISLIGAPCDAGANLPGAAGGPTALRSAGLLAALQKQGGSVHDCGDLVVQPPFFTGDTPGYHHLPDVAAWCHAVHGRVLTELQAGRRPVLLGGDHSLAIGSISAVARHCRAKQRPLRVLWLDAHADCNSRRTSPSANLHGMPVACLCGIGPAALTQMSGHKYALAADEIRELGVRSVDPGENQLVQQIGLHIWRMEDMRRLGMTEAVHQALAGMTAGTHLHVSFDIDFLAPDIAPGVATAVDGGANLAEACECMTAIVQHGPPDSLDVMEFNPVRDVQQRTAKLAVELANMLLTNNTCRPPDVAESVRI